MPSNQTKPKLLVSCTPKKKNHQMTCLITFVKIHEVRSNETVTKE